MKLLYQGKTKDVFELNGNTLRLKFSDRVTQNDAGQIDPGGNIRSGVELDGQAKACLTMTTTIFSELARKKVCDTHMLEFSLADMTMDVVKATMFAPGLEWVARWFCTGSFLRRYKKTIPTLLDGMPLQTPVFEITLKDDAAGDPPIVPSALVGMGIIGRDLMDILWSTNAKAMQAIREMFTNRGLDLWDIKIEWGLTKTGEPMLIDEISPGVCRAFNAGTRERVDGWELAKRFL